MVSIKQIVLEHPAEYGLGKKCTADWRKRGRKKIKYFDTICSFCNEKVEWEKTYSDSKHYYCWTCHGEISLCRACHELLYRLENYYDKFENQILKENYEEAKTQVLLLKWLMENECLDDGFIANGWVHGKMWHSTSFPKWRVNERQKEIQQLAKDAANPNKISKENKEAIK